MEERRVCVVGAGVSGLLACKYLLEKGFHPVVFESHDSIGGVWAHCTLNSTRLQSPPEAYQFSDFLWDETASGQLHYTQVLRYMEGYTQRFGLSRHLRLGERVLSLEFVGAGEAEMAAWELWGGSGDPFSSSTRGAWNVTVQRIADGSVEVHAMDFVVLCTGRFSDIPNIPTNFPNNNGPGVFHGKVIHSMDMARMGSAAAVELVKGKRVVVVGFLKSALDIAAMCSDINGEEYPCTMIIRTKRWIIPDFNVWGIPLFFFYFNRFAEFLIHKPNEGFLLFLLAFFLSPLKWLISKIVEAYYKRVIPMKKYGMVPEHSFSHALATCSVAISPENFYEKVKKGSIVLKQSKSFEFYEDGIIIKDKSFTQINADLVIFATGYKGDHKLINIFASPRFQDLMAGSLDSSFPLYRECIHPRIPQMVVIGYTESFANLYTSEMRAIWVSQFLNGGFRLPSIKLMEKDVVGWKKYMKRYGIKRSSISTIHTWYNDFLCKDIGCNPRRKKGFLANIFMPYGSFDYVGIGSVEKQ